MNRRTRFYKNLTAAVLGALMGLTGTAFAADTVQLDLSDSVRMALENNRKIKQSDYDVESAEWSLSQARRNTGLTMGWSGTAYAVGGDTYSRQNRDSDYTNTLKATYPLYTGGKNENSIKSARYGVNSADLALESTKQQIRYKATAGYYQILQNRNLIKVNQDAVSTLQEHLDNVNAQYRVGTVAKSDVLASQVQLANAQQALVTAQNNYDVSVATLNNVIGLPTDTVLDIHDDLKYTKYDLTLEGCTEYALLNRPDGLAADYAVKQAKSKVEVAKAGYRPTVSAVAAKYLDGNDAFNKDVVDQWYAGVDANWNFFDNGVTSAQVHAAKAALAKAEEVAAEQKETIQLEVRTQYLNLLAAEKNIMTTQVAVAQAEEDYKIAQVRYSAGVGTNLDVMDAEEKLTEARTNYYTALYNYNTSKAALDQAMGIPVDIDAGRYAAAEQAGRGIAGSREDADVHRMANTKEVAATEGTAQK